ncbi:MAG: hypothetical protein METHP_01156 [Methanoregula sp. SKADARSKE-2]|nr:MAG: hypothetical protein METHP_01156 [Methanoregula sp. SKADARSKE-2]
MFESAFKRVSPRSFRVHVAYDYRDTERIHISLPEIIVRIVPGPEQLRNTASPLASTSGPGTTDVPVTSSVSVREQAVSLRQHLAADTGSQTSLGGRGEMNASSLRDQQGRMQEEFTDRLNLDPLFSRVNESLVAQGFALRSLGARPATNTSGTFSAVYQMGTDRQVVLGGSMDAGIVPRMSGRSDAGINTTPALDSSSRLVAYQQELAATGYQLKETTFDATLSVTSVNMSFSNPKGGNAHLNGTDSLGNVTVSMAMAGDTPPIPTMAVAAVAWLISTCLILAWYSARRKSVVPAAPRGPATTYPVPSADALRLLASAQEAYSRNRYPEAYGLAGRALRLFISARYGAGEEMTVTEVISLFREISPYDPGPVEEILARCMDVEFARGEPVEGEFPRFMDLIWGMIGED